MATPQAKIVFLLLAALLALSLTHAGAGAQRARPERPGAQRGIRVAGRQPPQVGSWPEKSKRWALLVGVNRYEDERLNPLRYAANDATALSNALVEHAGFLKEQVVLLTSDQPDELQPTRINILTKLAEMEGKLPEDGLLLFAFSGHSIERAKRSFLFPSDGRLSSNPALLEESTLGVEKLKDYIRNTNAGQVVMLLDSCRNAPYAAKGEGDAMSTDFSRSFNFERRNKGIVAFATFLATNVGQFAYESRQKKQGFFSWAFVEGLKGAAANERGEVTLAGLKSYVQTTVIELIRKEYQAEIQQPDVFFQGYKSEELVLSVAPRTQGGAAAAPAAEKGLAAQNPQGITDEGFWFAVKDNNMVSDYKLYLKFFPEGQFADVARNKLAAIEADERIIEDFVKSKAEPVATPTPARSAASLLAPGVLKDLYGESHALVIGVSDYRNGFNDTPGVMNDVPAVKAALERHAFRVETLLNPTRREFDAAMREFVTTRGANPNDRLLVYFAGHGYSLRAPDGRNQAFIVLADTPAPGQSDQSAFRAAAVSMEEMELYAKRIQSKHAMFVFDSAFAGTLFEVSRGVETRGAISFARPAVIYPELKHYEIPLIILNNVRRPVRLFLAAGGADQMVPDKSIFRMQFVEGLNGEADINRDSYITGSELGVFLQDTVTRYSRGEQTPQWGKIRDPRLDKGDFVFVLERIR